MNTIVHAQHFAHACFLMPKCPPQIQLALVACSIGCPGNASCGLDKGALGLNVVLFDMSTVVLTYVISLSLSLSFCPYVSLHVFVCEPFCIMDQTVLHRVDSSASFSVVLGILLVASSHACSRFEACCLI